MIRSFYEMMGMIIITAIIIAVIGVAVALKRNWTDRTK